MSEVRMDVAQRIANDLGQATRDGSQEPLIGQVSERGTAPLNKW